MKYDDGSSACVMQADPPAQIPQGSGSIGAGDPQVTSRDKAITLIYWGLQFLFIVVQYLASVLAFNYPDWMISQNMQRGMLHRSQQCNMFSCSASTLYTCVTTCSCLHPWLGQLLWRRQTEWFTLSCFAWVPTSVAAIVNFWSSCCHCKLRHFQFSGIIFHALFTENQFDKKLHYLQYA